MVIRSSVTQAGITAESSTIKKPVGVPKSKLLSVSLKGVPPTNTTLLLLTLTSVLNGSVSTT